MVVDPRKTREHRTRPSGAGPRVVGKPFDSCASIRQGCSGRQLHEVTVAHCRLPAQASLCRGTLNCAGRKTQEFAGIRFIRFSLWLDCNSELERLASRYREKVNWRWRQPVRWRFRPVVVLRVMRIHDVDLELRPNCWQGVEEDNSPSVLV